MRKEVMKMRNKFASYSRSTSKTYTNANGYRVYKDSGQLVHRHMAEIKLGRSLQSGEVVHHINRNKQDNRPSNLYVFHDQQAHWAAHKQDAKNYGKDYSFKGKNH